MWKNKWKMVTSGLGAGQVLVGLYGYWGTPLLSAIFVRGSKWSKLCPMHAFVSKLRDEMGMNTRSTCREKTISNTAGAVASAETASTWRRL